MPPFVASSARGSTSIEPARLRRIASKLDGSDHQHDLLDVAAEIDELATDEGRALEA